MRFSEGNEETRGWVVVVVIEKDERNGGWRTQRKRCKHGRGVIIVCLRERRLKLNCLSSKDSSSMIEIDGLKV